MTQDLSRAFVGLFVAGCLALAGCRGESERLTWKSPLAWRPFGERDLAETPVPAEEFAPGAVGESAKLEGPLLAETPAAGPVREDDFFVSPDIGMPAPPPAPPAEGAWPIERITEGRRLPEGSAVRSPLPANGREGRTNLSEAIERLRERRERENRRADIPWNEPVAQSGEYGGASRAVGFDQYQPVTLGSPEFEMSGPLPQVIANGGR